MKNFFILVLVTVLCFGMPAGFTETALAKGDNCATISASEDYFMVIKADDSLWTWGKNYYGNLGDGTKTHKDTPIKLMDGVSAVSAGGGHTMAIKTDGSLWAWGENYYGPLGDGTNTARLTPVKIMDGVVAVSAGDIHTIAIKADGSLWTWGRNIYGEIGDGTATIRYSPVKIMDGVAAVAAGDHNSMAIKADGSLWAWGANGVGNLGDGTTTNRYSPVKVLDDVTAVSVGHSYTMATKTDGSLWAWGYLGAISNFGDGTILDKHISPIKVMDGVIAISAGESHAMAVKDDGSLWSWGSNYFGELGDVTKPARESRNYCDTPTKVMDSVVTVAAGTCHTLAIQADGSLWSWGNPPIGDGMDTGNYGSYKGNIPVKIMEGVKLPSKAAVQPPAPANTIIASSTSSTVLVNSKAVAFDAYNINDNNYFKLRDIAMALNGSEKQFEVGWDAAANAIALTSKKAYTKVGGELERGSAEAKQATPTTAKVYLNGKEVQLIAYNIGGNNYFKLRDIGQAFDFGVGWDGTANTITIDTSTGYKE